MNIRIIKYTLLIFLVMLLQVSCSSPKKLPKKKEAGLDALMHSLFDTPEVHTGFYLTEVDRDLKKHGALYEYNGEGLFTPASNTKILTLYAALKFLPEQLDGLKWRKEGNITLIQGTGDPGLLDSRFLNQPVFEFLKEQENIIVTDEWTSTSRWRPGWSWEDYSYYYAAQRSPIPIYGNMTKASCRQGEWNLSPKGFIISKFSNDKKHPIRRDEERNIFMVNASVCPEPVISVPFVWSPDILARLLSDTLRVPVIAQTLPAGDVKEWNTAKGSNRKEVLQTMMYESDNLIAEQLQWNISSTLWNTLDTRKSIDTLMHTDFVDWKGKIRWVDGSGLSVYNRFTPHFLAEVLQRLYREIPETELLDYFPAGGIRGTISAWYDGGEKPFVFAKTGTLSSVTTLSGYLLADSGRRYIFSFMHSNYICPAKRNKEKMEKVLRWIKENG